MDAFADPAALAAEVSEAAMQAGALLPLGDFHGRRSPIGRSPGAAQLPAVARRALASLLLRPATGIAVISGRDLRDIEERVGIPGLIHAGCHGLAVKGPGLRFAHPQARALQGALREM